METTSTIPSTITLNNGIDMPRVGLGTYAIKELPTVIYESIKDGLRMFDTASYYKNEKEVGEGVNKAIADGLVKREDLFVVTKLWVEDKHQPEVAIQKSLKELNLEYVDLYLVHWPDSMYVTGGKRMSVPNHVLWKNMEDLVKKGYTKSIGVSNYNVQSLMDLLTYCEIKPVVNQVEYHPYLFQDHLNKFCKDNGVYLTAYNSLTRGDYVRLSGKTLNILEEPITKELAEKYGKSTGVIALNWALVQDVIVIPSTNNPRRMKENLTALSFKLSEEDEKALSALNSNTRLLPHLFANFNGTGYDVFA